jgi:hypothetical protein
LYRFIRFFSQKLCICIALNDTFLSIAAQHWSRGCTKYDRNSTKLFCKSIKKHYEENFIARDFQYEITVKKDIKKVKV